MNSEGTRTAGDPPEPGPTEKGPAERRLHPVGMLLAALGTVRRLFGLSAVPGIAALFSGGFGMAALLLVLLGVALLAVLGAVWGVLSWRATTYRVSGGAFHLKRGVLQKSERSLPLEHVQGVDTVQGIVQRLFGVVEVRVEAAGGGREPEISLPALSRGAAESLREELAGSAARGGASPEASEEPTVLYKLSVRDLLLAGLTSGRIGVAVPVVVGASQTVDELVPGGLTGRLVGALAAGSPVSPALVLALAVVPVAWALAVAGTVLAHAGFTLSRSADGEHLHIRRGLFERHEATVPLARIQAVKVVEGVLRQPFGLAALRVESAGFGAEEGVSTELFPLLPRKEAEGLLRTATPRFAAPLDDLAPLPQRARRRYATRAALPVAAVLAPLAALLFPWGLFAFLLAVPAALYGLLRHRAAGHNLDGERIVLRFRRLARTTAIVPRGRLQSRGYSVSPLQRRKGLATFEVEVASGSGGTTYRLADVEASSAVGLVERMDPVSAPDGP